MATVYSMTRASGMFDNPIKPTQQTPLSNLTFGFISQNIYSQSIAKTTKSAMSTYLSSLNKNTFDLKSAAKSFLTNSADSSFSKKAVTSPDTALTGTASSSAKEANYTLNVTSLATTQKNSSLDMLSAEPTNFSHGTNTFKITSGTSTRLISFNINDTDTNKNALDKMAKSINSANAGVSASVFSNEKTGKSFLQLQTTKTGEQNAFSISDVTGNAVSTSMVSDIKEEAKDAIYKVNGADYKTSENTAVLQDGKVKIDFTKAEGKDISVSVAKDTMGITNDIKNLVKAFNNEVRFAASNSANYSGADKLKSELSKVFKYDSSSLANIGISANNDGTLSVDDKILSKAVSENTSYAKDVMSRFSDKLNNKSTEIISSPTKYSTLNVQNFQDSLKSLYNTQQMKYGTSYFTQGLLVDTFR